MYMSGIELPSLGSTRDKVLRKFMDYETRRRLKSEQVNWTIAYITAGKENQQILKDLWDELVDLEFGEGSILEAKPKQDELEKRWLAEYEAMKQRDVRLVRTGGKLSVTGL